MEAKATTGAGTRGTDPHGTPLSAAPPYDSLGAAVVAVDAGMAITSWNRAAQLLYGWSEHEVLGRQCSEVYGLESSGRAAEALDVARAGGRWSGDLPIRHRDGRILMVHTTAQALYDDRGTFAGVVGVGVDMTGRQADELAAARLAAIVATSTDAILTKTRAGIITSWNPAAEELYGYTAEEAVGRHVSLIVPPSRRQELDAIMQRVASGEAVARTETERSRRDGTKLRVLLSVSPLFDAGGQVIGASSVAHDITARKAHEAEVQRLAAIVESSTDAILSKTPDGLITSWNDAAERLYGYDAEEVLGRHVSMLVPAERLAELDEILTKIAAGSTIVRLRTSRVRKDGSVIPVLLNVWPLFDDDGEVMGASTVTRDLTAEVAAADEREAADRRFQAAFRRSKFGMLIADLDGYPTAVNQAACELLGRAPEELIGTRWDAFAHPDDAHLVSAMVADIRLGAESSSSERRYLRPDGSVVWVAVTVNVVRDNDDRPLYLMAQMLDIGDRKRIEAELAHRALHDGLTGLPNRALLDDRLARALAASRRSGRRLGVAFLDIDGFKHVNDALGHIAGDRLLTEVARRLRRCVRPSDTVARFGGDEFVMVFEDVDNSSLPRLVSRVTETLTSSFLVVGRELVVRASIGTTVSQPTSTTQSLLSEADAAMYRAKELGSGQVVAFDDTFRRRAESMLEAERALRSGLRNHEFVPYYQPIVDLRSGQIVGVEALARWQRPDGTIGQPDGFISVAEDTGLIVELGELILERAASDTASWNAQRPDTALWVSVNLSPHQLNDGRLPDVLVDILRRAGLPHSLLHLEITESALVRDVELTVPVLEALKGFGVQISIDDFGTGYSSLSYLRQLPVDTLKIDRSFVAPLGMPGADPSIVQTILTLANALNLRCVAEGVELLAQADALATLGCTLAQGYLWSAPLSPEAAGSLLSGGRGLLTPPPST